MALNTFPAACPVAALRRPPQHGPRVPLSLNARCCNSRRPQTYSRLSHSKHLGCSDLSDDVLVTYLTNVEISRAGHLFSDALEILGS